VQQVLLYTTEWCGLCSRAKHLLEQRGIPYREVSLDDDPAFRQRVFDLGGQWTVPLVVVGETVIGGYRELAALDRSGDLDARLAA
jgi:glutaredoxin 3